MNLQFLVVHLMIFFVGIVMKYDGNIRNVFLLLLAAIFSVCMAMQMI